ncbi:MAG: adenylate kinase family protein [Gammaproteobacteria bacterium]
MKILLIGPPGAGKGTQAEKLVNQYRLNKIVMGDLVRACIASKNQLGQTMKSIVETGQLLPDDLIIAMFKQHIEENPNILNQGFLLDGFPRTIEQAKALEGAGISLDFVLELQVPDNVIVERLSGRRVHLASGRTYHIVYNPPLIAEHDNVTGESLIQREDDKEETIKARLAVYHEQTELVIGWYHDNKTRCFSIDASLSIDEVWHAICQVIDCVQS